MPTIHIIECILFCIYIIYNFIHKIVLVKEIKMAVTQVSRRSTKVEKINLAE